MCWTLKCGWRRGIVAADMKRAGIFLLLVLPILFAGCETVSKGDREVLTSHGVSQRVLDVMEYGDPLSLGDVIELSQHDVPAGLIVHYMDKTDSAYRLRKPDVTHLRDAGVSEEVIAYMLSTAPPYGLPPGPGPYGRPYPYGYGPYDYDYGYVGGPYLGPVVVVGGGGYWHRGGWGHRGW